MQSSLRNLACIGTCLIASIKGMLTCTLQQVAKTSYSYASFLDLANMLGKGIVEVSININIGFWFYLRSCSFLLWCEIGFLGSSGSYFFLFKVLAWAFYYWSILVWNRSIANFWASSFSRVMAIWSIRFFMLSIEVSTWWFFHRPLVEI